MSVETAPQAWLETWLEDIVVDVTELDLMTDLDPGSLNWNPLPRRVSA